MTDKLALKERERERRQGTVSKWPSAAGNFNSEMNVNFPLKLGVS
jgi:hypothetical protein